MAGLEEDEYMSTLAEVRQYIAELQPQFDTELSAYLAAVRDGNSQEASAALERMRPIGDRLQPLLVERCNLERMPQP